jgi:DNA-binding GntR family transcriptional regulator
VRHHKPIVTAISAKEPDDAQRHLRQHLSGPLGYLAEIRAHFPEYLSE